MIWFVLRRVVFSLASLLLVSFILFALTLAIPVSPARTVLGVQATEAQVRQFEHDHGLDRSLIVQFGAWLEQAVHGSFGTSLVTGLDIDQEIGQTLPVTLELVGVAFVVAVFVSVALGTLSALYEGSLIDHAARVFAIVGVSIPGFWLALLLILVFAVDLPWFPPGGIASIGDGVGGYLDSLVLPTFCLSVSYVAILSRMTRSSLVEVLGRDHIRTARAAGLRRFLVLRYALKNALVPVVTVAAMSFGYMFGWAVIIETVFNIGGLSGALLQAIDQRDYALVRAVVVVFTVIFLLSNLLADILNGWLDPRLGRMAR